MATQQKPRQMSALRSYTPFAFLPMLVALGFLVGMRLVSWQDAAWAAGLGSVAAAKMLWPLTPWMQRRYTRR